MIQIGINKLRQTSLARKSVSLSWQSLKTAEFDLAKQKNSNKHPVVKFYAFISVSVYQYRH